MNSPALALFIISQEQTFLAQYRPDLRSVFDLVPAADERIIVNTLKMRTVTIAVVDMEAPVSGSISTLKKLNPQIKIIAISAKWNAEKDISALEQGADISIPMPLNVRQLILRIKQLTVTQKSHSATAAALPFTRPTAPLGFRGLVILPNEYLVRRHDQIVNVTPTQFRLLICFLNSRNRLLSRQWLKEQVWQDTEISLRSIDAQVSKLKKALPELEGPLLNIYGEGYILSDVEKKTA